MRQILLGIILHSALGGTNLKNLAMVTGVDMDKMNQEQDQELGLKVWLTFTFIGKTCLSNTQSNCYKY